MRRTLTSRPHLLLLAVALVLSAGRSARAQARDRVPSGSEDPDARRREQQARARYDEGITRYNLAEYDAAIAAFKAAYALMPAPGFLYNIGQSFRLKGDCAQALLFYRNYLRAEPDAARRARAEPFVPKMEQCAKATTQPPTAPQPWTSAPPAPGGSEPAPVDAAPGPPASPAAPIAPARADGVAVPAATAGGSGAAAARPAAPPVAPALVPTSSTNLARAPAGERKRVAGLIALSAGAAVLGVGIYFGREASAKEDRVTAFFAMGGTWSPELQRVEDDGRRASTVAALLLSAGAAAMVAGGALYYWGRRQERAERRHLLVVPTQGGAAANLTWRY